MCTGKIFCFVFFREKESMKRIRPERPKMKTLSVIHTHIHRDTHASTQTHPALSFMLFSFFLFPKHCHLKQAVFTYPLHLYMYTHTHCTSWHAFTTYLTLVSFIIEEVLSFVSQCIHIIVYFNLRLPCLVC